MKKLELAFKIILTILSIALACGVIYILFKAIFFSQSIDEAVYYGIMLGAVGGSMFIINLCGSTIAQCWEKKDKENKK